MRKNRSFLCFPYVCLIVLEIFLQAVPAQTIQNVTRLSTVNYSAVAGEDFIVADVWGFTRNGREYAVIARTEAGVSIVDVTDPVHPSIVSNIAIPVGASRLYHCRPYNGYIYAVMRPGPLQIIDARDPNNATEVKQYTTGFNSAYAIFIADTVAYLVDVDSDRTDVNLIILDISDPVNPVELGTWYRTYHHVFVRNDTLIGFVQKGEIDFLDVSDPSNIQLLYQISNTGANTHSGWLNDAGTLLSVDHEIAGGHLDVLDISTPSSITITDSFLTATNNEGETSLHHSRWYFDLLYLSYWQDCLRIVDASNPNNLQQIAVYDTISPNPATLYRGFWGIYPYAPSRNLYVSDPKTGLIILDYQNDGPGISTNEFSSISYAGDTLRAELRRLNGNAIVVNSSYLYYRTSPQSNWQRQLLKSTGASDSFFFKIYLPEGTRVFDYYLQVQDANGQKTRAPGLAPYLDFYRISVDQPQNAPERQLFISEVSDGTNPSNAFLEIYNASSQNITLNKGKIVRCANTGNSYEKAAYVFDFGSDEYSSQDTSTVVPAGGFLIVAAGTTKSAFEAEWGALSSNANFNSGNSQLKFGEGSGTRWVLLFSGNSDSFDGMIVDQTPTNAGADGTVFQQKSQGQWQSTNLLSEATPGALSSDQSLPVFLRFFKATWQQNGLLLQWETASEINNQGFELLRKEMATSSADLLASFRVHSELQGAGSSSTFNTYQFLDKTATLTKTYIYFLKSIDLNGKIHLVDSLTVFPSEAEQTTNPVKPIITFPNPFNSQITILLNSASTSDKKLKIFNIVGKLIKTLDVQSNQQNMLRYQWNGMNAQNLPVPSGVYFVTTDKIKPVKILLLR